MVLPFATFLHKPRVDPTVVYFRQRPRLPALSDYLAHYTSNLAFKIKICGKPNINFLIYNYQEIALEIKKNQLERSFILTRSSMNESPGNEKLLLLWGSCVCNYQKFCWSQIHECTILLRFLAITLKGQCHKIFCFWFFSWISFPPAPEYSI